MKRKIISILSIVISLALSFSGCDSGLFDDQETSSGSTPGVVDGYRVSKYTQTYNGDIYIYSYDYVSGSKIDKITATLNGSAYSTTKYNYDSNNNISEVSTTYTNSNYPTITVKYSDYDAYHNYRRADNYNGTSLSSYFKYTFTYNSNSEITSLSQKGYDANGTLISTTESTYKDGRIVRSETSSSSSEYSSTSVATYKYDSHGCITELSTTATATISGTTSTSTSTITYTNEYSSTGNLIKQTQTSGIILEYEYEKY